MSSSATQQEVFFDPSDIIVSKTDTRGRITYANRVFCDIAGYRLEEIVGQPHSIIRHPEMPRCIFKLLWDHLLRGEEVFAYVKNTTKDRNHYYWVLAHVTPSFNDAKEVIGFHSNRRVPNRETVNNTIIPLYASLLAEEEAHRNGKEAVNMGYQKLMEFVKSTNKPYDELMFSI